MSQKKKTKKKEKNRKHQNKNAHVIKEEEEEEECSDVRGFVDSYKFWTEKHHDARKDIPSTELAKTTPNTARLPKTHNYKTAESSQVVVATSSLDLRKLQVSRRILLPAHNCGSILLFLLLLYFFPWWFCLVRGKFKKKKMTPSEISDYTCNKVHKPKQTTKNPTQQTPPLKASNSNQKLELSGGKSLNLWWCSVFFSFSTPFSHRFCEPKKNRTHIKFFWKK